MSRRFLLLLFDKYLLLSQQLVLIVGCFYIRLFFQLQKKYSKNTTPPPCPTFSCFFSKSLILSFALFIFSFFVRVLISLIFPLLSTFLFNFRIFFIVFHFLFIRLIVLNSKWWQFLTSQFFAVSARVAWNI